MTWCCAGLLLTLWGCGGEASNGLASDPFWLQDATSTFDGGGASDGQGAGQDDAGNTAATDSATEADGAGMSDGSDASPAVQTQYFASLQLDRVMSQDPSPFGNAWAESRTTTLGLVKVTWNGDVGTRWLHVCAMRANKVHGSQVSFSSAFLTAVPTIPHQLTRSGGTWTQPAAVDLIGVVATHTGPMPALGEAKHPSLRDADKDGEPGVTVQVNITMLGDQEIYVAQRNSSAWTGKIDGDGELRTTPTVTMEQSIVGASLSLLIAKPAEKQVASGTPHTLIWVPVAATMTCATLVSQAANLFGTGWPPTP